MKIEGIVLSCFKYDWPLARICIASIRYWYPDIPIWLLKDQEPGAFDTGEAEKYWHVQVYPSKRFNQGWGFGKLDVMTELPARRLLFIDADVVIVGRVIDRLEQFDADLVVEHHNYRLCDMGELFFALEKLHEFDPDFAFPGHAFNGGQIVATTGRLTAGDFAGLIDWEKRRVNHPDIFQMGDQGLLNYVALRKAQKGELVIHREPFMLWPGEPEEVKHLRLDDFSRDSAHRELIHWAGLRWGKKPSQMPRADILEWFEERYYERIPFGPARRYCRRFCPYGLRDLCKGLDARLRGLLR
ncbi:MAG TPA: hypothetical protein PLP17_06820 [Oligoflexia bacterium]|nr:hypothetical protein [Oligoflexia bacterium]